MTTQQVADRLIALCRKEKNVEALKELYAPSIVSIEMPWVPNMNVVSKGKEAVTKKNVDWLANIKTMHSSTVSDPIVAGNHFTTKMTFDAARMDGSAYYLEELAVYEVKVGKIVSEKFFYSM